MNWIIWFILCNNKSLFNSMQFTVTRYLSNDKCRTCVSALTVKTFFTFFYSFEIIGIKIFFFLFSSWGHPPSAFSDWPFSPHLLCAIIRFIPNYFLLTHLFFCRIIRVEYLQLKIFSIYSLFTCVYIILFLSVCSVFLICSFFSIYQCVVYIYIYNTYIYMCCIYIL